MTLVLFRDGLVDILHTLSCFFVSPIGRSLSSTSD